MNIDELLKKYDTNPYRLAKKLEISDALMRHRLKKSTFSKQFGEYKKIADAIGCSVEELILAL